MLVSRNRRLGQLHNIVLSEIGSDGPFWIGGVVEFLSAGSGHVDDIGTMLDGSFPLAFLR
jgi:hypothetical protein